MTTNQKLIQDHNRELLDALDPILSNINNRFIEEKATNPLLISHNSDYFNSDLRIMLFGQETNKWNIEYNNGLYAHNQESLEKRYDEFFWERGCFDYGRLYGGMWRGAEYLMNEVERHLKPRETKFIWNNLIKVGKLGKGRPDFYGDIRDLNRYAILREIEIFKPDFIILFSGPNYDDILNDVFNLEPKKSIDGYTAKQMAVININGINGIRTYHPGFLLRNDYQRYYRDITSYVASLSQKT